MAETPRRATQAERSARTVAALVQGAIDAVIELGYAGATVREICRRAGVSQGALFRHFDSRSDVLLAAVDEVHRRHLGALQRVVSETGTPVDIVWLEELRARARLPESFVWLEVLLAARTDPELQPRVAAHLHRLDERIVAAAAQHPALSTLRPEDRRMWITIARRMVQGSTIVELGLTEPSPAAPKLRALLALYRMFADGSSAT